MANNAFNFKGLYDKVVGLLKNDAILDPGAYSPNDNDYVAVYKNIPASAGIADNTIAVKQYVSVTDIGTGGGGGGGSMTSFQVAGEGGIIMSVNGGDYGSGPFTIENDAELTIDSSSVPNGLNWRGDFENPSAGATFEINDVVYTNTGSPVVYKTWFAIQEQNVLGAVAPPTGTAFSNAYWALLGTQGPAGDQGAQGQPSSTATFGFVPKPSNGAPVNINVTGNVGTSTNDIGKILLVNNSSQFSEAVITIASGIAGNTTANGWPFNSQITIINISDEDRAPVKIVGATTPAAVTLNSADGAQYLRTRYSTCSIVRRSENEYYMFGDLTNIA
jgi:hypothetical protein